MKLKVGTLLYLLIVGRLVGGALYRWYWGILGIELLFYAAALFVLFMVLPFFIHELRIRRQGLILKTFLIGLPIAVLISFTVDSLGQLYLDSSPVVLEAANRGDEEMIELFLRENQTFKLIDYGWLGSLTYYGYYEKINDGYLLTNSIPGADLDGIDGKLVYKEKSIQLQRTYSDSTYTYTLIAEQPGFQTER